MPPHYRHDDYDDKFGLIMRRRCLIISLLPPPLASSEHHRRIFESAAVRHTDQPTAILRSGDERGTRRRHRVGTKINYDLMENSSLPFSHSRLHETSAESITGIR